MRGEHLQSAAVAPATPPAARSLVIPLTEKAFETVNAEAVARSITTRQLVLAALMDFLGRHKKTKGGRRPPLVLHFPPLVRKRVVAAALADGMTVNAFIVAAALKAAEASGARRAIVPELTEDPADADALEFA
jgi:hypothetical protein